jgi:pyruvate-formate lyase-activating enzyme
VENLHSTQVGMTSEPRFQSLHSVIEQASQTTNGDMRAAAGLVINAIRSNSGLAWLVDDPRKSRIRTASDAEEDKLVQLLRYVQATGELAHSFNEPARQGETAADLIRQARDTVTFINPMYFSCGLDSRQLKMYERALHTERKRKGSNCRKKLKQQWK